MALLLSEDGYITAGATLEEAVAVVQGAGYTVCSFPFYSDRPTVPNYYIEGLCGPHHRSRLRDTGDGRLHVSCFTCWNGKPAGLLSSLLRDAETAGERE